MMLLNERRGPFRALQPSLAALAQVDPFKGTGRATRALGGPRLEDYGTVPLGFVWICVVDDTNSTVPQYSLAALARLGVGPLTCSGHTSNSHNSTLLELAVKSVLSVTLRCSLGRYLHVPARHEETVRPHRHSSHQHVTTPLWRSLGEVSRYVQEFPGLHDPRRLRSSSLMAATTKM